MRSSNGNPRGAARTASLATCGLIVSSQLSGCLMNGDSPSGSDSRVLYAAIIIIVLAVVLWLVLRYIR